MIKKIRILFLIFLVLGGVFAFTKNKTNNNNEKLKLYWFIPDGLRNDPDIFTVYKWAKEGKLPNIKKMMEKGSYGYSIPDFPSHTPTNFSTLLTGNHPNKHGISDGAIRIEGYPLSLSAISGFKSNSKWTDAAWTIFEKNNLRTFLLTIPGSSPPETAKGSIIRGRWGGWGADFYAINFQDESDINDNQLTNKNDRLFRNGAKLTEITNSYSQKNQIENLKSFSPVKEISLNTWDNTSLGFITDSTDDNKINYDTLSISFNKKQIAVNLKVGQWSDWTPIKLKWRTRDDFNLYTPQKTELEKEYSTLDINTQVKIKLIRLTADGKFRIRYLYNILNNTLTSPETLADDLNKNVGPMVDFVDNFPPQLVYYPEDKQTFLEEANMTLDWHKKATGYIIDKYKPEVFIQDTYTPNQMLTSKWWTGYIDPASTRYKDITDIDRAKLWEEVKDMYQKIDAIIGEAISKADDKTTLVFSSDNGSAALNKEVYLNNLFAKKGWLTIKYDNKNKIYDIDWDKTKVAFIENTNIYINPKGLGGNWKRSSGEEYEKLRNEVIKILSELKDSQIFPLEKYAKWEDSESVFNLPKSQSGDIVIANKIGYQWTEEVNDSGEIFKTPLKSGYKQGIVAKDEKALWTSFIIMGPNIKSNYEIKNPISNADQLPTILAAMGIKNNQLDGKIIQEIILAE
jgi:predicted AlkP superfamily phosphohydrolase/phosphomutase